MRPIYETSENRAQEQAVADRLEAVWKCKIFKCRPLYAVDRIAEKNGKVSALIEIKCRTNPKTEYPTYMISAEKKVNGCVLAEYLKVPFFLVVQWADALGYYRLWADVLPDIRLGGRSDRNDSGDIEPVFHIPITYFTNLR